MWGGALYTVDKQLHAHSCIVVCGDIAYPTINGVSRISAKGVLQVRLNMEREEGGGGGGGGFSPPDFCTSGIKISEVVIINCKALAIQ